jgi:hypothetical protein
LTGSKPPSPSLRSSLQMLPQPPPPVNLLDSSLSLDHPRFTPLPRPSSIHPSFGSLLLRRRRDPPPPTLRSPHPHPKFHSLLRHLHRGQAAASAASWRRRGITVPALPGHLLHRRCRPSPCPPLASYPLFGCFEIHANGPTRGVRRGERLRPGRSIGFAISFGSDLIGTCQTRVAAQSRPSYARPGPRHAEAEDSSATTAGNK